MWETHNFKIMALCKYLNDYINQKSIQLDNKFISDFVPVAPADCVKVYLYGLLKCQTPSAIDNNIDSFAKVLNMSVEDVESAFYYWEELNLVQVIYKDPFEVRFLPVDKASLSLKKYSETKFKKFNIAIQEIITGRMITPTEYQEYYYLIEAKHIEPDALIMIAKYCANQKGENVGYPYVLTVAKNWINSGVVSVDDVEKQVQEIEQSSGILADIIKAMGSKRSATSEEYQTYLIWKNTFEIPDDILIYLAKKVKGMGGFNKLNKLVEKCYTLKLESIKEINDYFENEEKILGLAKNVCKNLGAWYDSLDAVVDNYISNWLKLGFDDETILKIANYCFKSNIKTLQGMDLKINQMFKLGLLTLPAIDSYISNLISNDEVILNILQKLGIDRIVNSSDRLLYKTWVSDWQINEKLIEYAISLSIGKYMPLSFMNQVLSKIHDNKIESVEEAKKMNLGVTQSPKQENANYMKRDYSTKELNSLFDNLDEVEI